MDAKRTRVPRGDPAKMGISMEEPRCPVLLPLPDDQSLFECELPKGHTGAHRQTGVQERPGGTIDYCIYWSYQNGETTRDYDV